MAKRTKMFLVERKTRCGELVKSYGEFFEEKARSIAQRSSEKHPGHVVEVTPVWRTR